MRFRPRPLGGLVAVSAIALLAPGRVSTAQSTRLPEDTLLGIKLLSSTYKDVLRKFGPPKEIQVGGPFIPDTQPPNYGSGAAANTGGGGGGFGAGMSGPMGMMGGGRRGGGSPYGGGGGGMMGLSGGGPATGGAAGGSGGRSRETSKTGFGPDGGGAGGSGRGAGGPMGMMGGQKGGGGGGMLGLSGGAPGPGMSGGLPGFSGGRSPGGSGSPYGGGYQSGSSGSMGDSSANPGMSGGEEEQPPVNETTWWYHNFELGEHVSFLFNKDGRVIQISEYGWGNKAKIKWNGATRQGVRLGSKMGDVLGRYGFSKDGANQGDKVTLYYGGTNRLAIQLVRNSVIGITVGVVRPPAPPAPDGGAPDGGF